MATEMCTGDSTRGSRFSPMTSNCRSTEFDELQSPESERRSRAWVVPFASCTTPSQLEEQPNATVRRRPQSWMGVSSSTKNSRVASSPQGSATRATTWVGSSCGDAEVKMRTRSRPIALSSRTCRNPNCSNCSKGCFSRSSCSPAHSLSGRNYTGGPAWEQRCPWHESRCWATSPSSRRANRTSATLHPRKELQLRSAQRLSPQAPRHERVRRRGRRRPSRRTT